MSTENSQTSMNFQSADRGEFQALPGFGVKPASAILSSTPSSWNTRLVEGTSDSPTWSLGWMSFSRMTTLWPSLARYVPNAEPAGPPPMTSTSASSSGTGMSLLQLEEMDSPQTLYGPRRRTANRASPSKA